MRFNLNFFLVIVPVLFLEGCGSAVIATADGGSDSGASMAGCDTACTTLVACFGSGNGSSYSQCLTYCETLSAAAQAELDGCAAAANCVPSAIDACTGGAGGPPGGDGGSGGFGDAGGP